MKLGILTISDSVPLGKRADLNGPKIQELLGSYFQETLYQVCTDDPAHIKELVTSMLPRVDILITNGGTGIMPRDNTVEVLRSLGGAQVAPLERAISAAIVLECGPLAAISTPVVLIIQDKYLIALPGRTDEVTAAIQEIIKPFFLHHLLISRIEIKNFAREFIQRENLYAE